MKIKVGLDIGGSTTKIVGMQDGKIIAREIVRAADPVTSAFGAVGKLINDHSISVNDIEQINITGVGSGYPQAPIFGIKTVVVEEFKATGLGGLYLSGLEHAVVVSMGTGTAYLEATKNNVRHIIGSGVGGGTLVGLGMALTGTSDAVKLSDMATSGDILKCDLTIGDITKNGVTGLPMNVTASNFGKAADDLSREDKMAGVFNLVYQAVGTVAVMASRQCNLKDIVFTGQLTDLKECQQYLLPFEDLYGVNMIIPEDAVFATALGSCLAEGQADK
ncbi:MAG: type II pantothenate kinase [Clostridiales bacterium]|jgi:type II pantothenate kinase|nr:type II pantothenate kinase [Oscillospiraceae bacterium]MBR0395105.1 type II pantothenate kinase [Clostridiales bacterium]